MNLDDPEARPWFLWSEDMTVAELREVLGGARGAWLRAVYMGRLMREARLCDVWRFLTPQQISSEWHTIRRHLGMRERGWRFLLSVWRREGLIDG